ncbi:NAD(P)-dependent oxidoreductase [Streptomyces sp. NP-1717]|uniref:NAD(P)-dependent oxidoreductase n=1 Tax=unclassified Streptomyces TaxID=2593676 RepID=UPI001F5C8683|nr:NAD(P)-binding domain-containing protein [Streptomyces sp. NP-1717]MCI3225652.1 NAD(P)-dependent oxidoreductase [Streptomyces sp. NP-1717]WTA74674.1 NAD(P)-binding domain-containing protein [Streptomyces sp. NBC_00838]
MNAAAPVTVLGLGLMGQALAEAFLREGHPTTVWNRTASRAEPLVAKGAALADSVADAVAASPLVIVCVLDYDAVHELLDPVAGTLDGRVLVNLTSGTSEGARETARWAAEHGGTYLDGAILTDPDGVGTADAVILYSGPRATFEAHEPTLGLIGGGTTHLGEDHGLSSLYDVAVLGLMWGVLNSFLQGAAVLGAAGVDASTFAQLATRSVKMVADWVPGYAEQIDKGVYPAVDATLNTHLASMDHLVHESEFLGVSAEFPEFVRALARRSVANGHGAEGYASMIELFRKPSGTRE